MLARGHTAKTIAAALGVSVAAVNERLRAARRRTGAGSSRELARLLAQQNRDDFSEVADGGRPPFRPVQPAPQGRWSIRRNVMITAAALAAVLAVSIPQLIGQPQEAAPSMTGPEADIVARLSSNPNPQQLRDRLGAETRDDAWAVRTESGIRERYSRMPVAARSLDTLSVTCAATLCEVIGRTRSGAKSDDVASLLGEVQSGELNASIEQLGLNIRSSAFTADPNNPGGMAFVAYLERSGGD